MNLNPNEYPPKPEIPFWAAVLAALALAVILVGLMTIAGCTTARKAVKYMDNHHSVAEDYNRLRYPCKDSVHESIVIHEGQPIVLTDSVTVTDTFVKNNTTFVDRVKTKTITKTIHDTVETQRVIYQTDKALNEELNDSLSAYRQSVTLLRDRLSRRTSQRNWGWGILAVLIGGAVVRFVYQLKTRLV